MLNDEHMTFIANLLARISLIRNEMVLVMLGVSLGLNELIDALQGADFTTFDGVSVFVSVVLAFIARASVWARDTVDRVRRGLE